MRLSRTVELWISGLPRDEGEALSKRDREANASFPVPPFEHSETFERGSNPWNYPGNEKDPHRWRSLS